MDTQFVDEPIEKIPEANKLYYIKPLLQTTGLTYLMKLILCAKYSDGIVGIIKKIINENPEEINKQCNLGWTPLMIVYGNAEYESTTEIIELLLSQPNIDVNKQNINGSTALIIACEQLQLDSISHIEKVKLLLNHPKIDIDKQNKEGNTALIMACLRSYGKVVAILDHKNVDVNKKNSMGRTALMMAYEFYSTRVIKLLLKVPNIYVDKKTLSGIIEEGIVCFEMLIPIIFCPLKLNYGLIGSILKFHKDKDMIVYYLNLHTIVKKKILKCISGSAEELYFKPNNIIALCSEVNFKLKYKKNREVFEELDNKLKFIFDIKDENDMIKKISYYL